MSIFNNIINNDKGMTLIEVLFALSLFAVFATSFSLTQSGNIANSMNMREEIVLRELCFQKINEIIVKPPRFSESLTLTDEEKDFESNPDYKYTITYKKFVVPNLMGKMNQEGANEDDDGSSPMSGIEKNLTNKIKDNLQKIIWQVRVTVSNKSTKFNYSLSTWLLNEEAKIDLGSI